MLPKRIKVKNFTSYVDETIEFEDFGSIFCVLGYNGAGKSSIIDMITTALFYRARGVDKKGTGMDSLVNNNAEKFEIEFEFTMNNNDYKIIRTKARGGEHTLQLFINGSSQTEKIGETQTKINNILKMDYETFLDTICVGQGQSGRFMSKKPNERKDVFVQVLGLDKYEVLEEHAKKMKKEVNSQIESLEEQHNMILTSIEYEKAFKEELEEKQNVLSELNNLLSQSEEELEKVLEEKVMYETMKQQQDRIISQRNNIKQKINNLTYKLSEYDNKKKTILSRLQHKESINKEIDILEESISNDKEKYNELNAREITLTTESNILISQAKEMKVKFTNLKEFDGAICDFCGNNIDDKHKKQHLNELVKQGKELIAQSKRKEEEVSTIKEQLLHLKNNINENTNKLNNYKNKLDMISRGELELSMIEKEEINYQGMLQEANDENEKMSQIELLEVQNKTFNDMQIRNTIANYKNRISSIQSRIAVLNNELIKLSDIISNKEEIEEKLTELKLLSGDYDSLCIAYGKAGIQADIIANSLPEIENEVNDLLEILSGNVKVQFKTQKDTKGKKPKKATSIETLDIVVLDGDKARSYETYSGGERFRVDFSCHVGLARFLAKRAGSTMNFFMIDEGLGSQDQSAKSQFVTSVQRLSSIFKQIMVITHIEDLQNCFDKQVLISKDPLNGSKVQLMK